jgi:hypothetical protein
MSGVHPVRAVFHRATRARPDPSLLVLLPGFDMSAEDFVTHGFVDTVHDCVPGVDVLAAEPDLDTYLDGTAGEQIAELVRAEAIGRYSRVWLAGISLGCFGALLAAGQPCAIEGIVLLAPFLGTPGLIAEIGRAGGLAAWEPGEIAANDVERRLLARLKGYHAGSPEWPILLLGYGRSDRFAAASQVLAAILPPDRVCEIDGAHDWPSWSLLWRRILATDLLARRAGG